MTKLLVFLFAALAPSLLWADYEPESSEWNGLQELNTLAMSEGARLEFTDTLDYRALEADKQPLILIYPQAELDVRSLSRFVLDGGRVLVADDFGSSEPLLDRLEIRRVVPSPGNLPHSQFVDQNPALPLFEPAGRHPLLDGVDRVVANHPAVVSNPGGPVVGYDAGGALVYDMNLGPGKVIVVGDASLLINQMLGVADNGRFVANAIRYLCAERDLTSPCQPRVLVRDFKQQGIYDDGIFDGDQDVSSTVDQINESISDLMDALPGSELLYYLSILMAAGLALYLMTIFPLRRTRAYSAYVSDFFDAIPQPQSEFDWNLSRFGHGGRNMNYALPLSILKESFEEVFLDELGYWPSEPGNRPDVSELADMVIERHGKKLSAAEKKQRRNTIRELLGLMARIPSRNRVFLDSDAHFSEADLLKIHRLTVETLRLMGIEDEYKRRTRTNL